MALGQSREGEKTSDERQAKILTLVENHAAGGQFSQPESRKTERADEAEDEEKSDAIRLVTSNEVRFKARIIESAVAHRTEPGNDQAVQLACAGCGHRHRAGPQGAPARSCMRPAARRLSESILGIRCREKPLRDLMVMHFQIRVDGHGHERIKRALRLSPEPVCVFDWQMIEAMRQSQSVG